MQNNRTFVVVDGPDFSGKSTLMKAFLARLEQEQIAHVAIREPGSVAGEPSMAEEVRATLIAKRDEVVHPETDVLLHMGYRIQNIKNVIKPALDAGKWVIADRFIFSTWCLNVQANLPTHPHLVEMFYGLMPYVLKGIPEPLTFILDTPRAIRDERAASDVRKKDRYESQAKDVHDRIEAAYEQLRSAPSCVFLDGTKSTEELVEQMLETVKEFNDNLQEQLASEVARTEVVEERKLTADERMQELRTELEADPEWNLDTKCTEYVRDHITLVADRLFPGAVGDVLAKYTKEAEEFAFKAAKAVFLKSEEDRTIFHPSRIGQINQKVHSVLNFSFMKEQWNELFDREGIKPAE